MIPAIVGRKVGMTRVYDADGRVAPVTVVQAGPCTVTQVRTPERDGYHAVQLGFEDAKPHRSSKALIGHAAKAGTGPKRVHREVRLQESPDVEVGGVVSVARFEEGEVHYVDVSGITKGCGFAGVMKRHGFGGKEASHGTERKHRSAGSIGGSASLGAGRAVKKGKRMAGHMGHVRVTARNHRLIAVDKDHDLLLIEGSVPGPNGGLLFIRQAKCKG
ncbi:MAG: 50S ribosomal protein L3 [bacterium]|nr:50S ribosomal protein L3 [bacterium]